MKKNILFLLLLASSLGVWAQNNVSVNKITWHSSASVLLTTNYTLDQSCTVVTDPATSKITITNGDRVNEFTISQHEGVWENAQTNGRVVFTVLFGEDPGVITIEKNNTETFIEIDMTQNPSGVKRKIIINQVITE